MFKVGDKVQILPSIARFGVPSEFIGCVAVVCSIADTGAIVIEVIDKNTSRSWQWRCRPKHLKKIQPSETVDISIWNYI